MSIRIYHSPTRQQLHHLLGRRVVRIDILADFAAEVTSLFLDVHITFAVEILEKACSLDSRNWLRLVALCAVGGPQNLWLELESGRIGLLQACHFVAEDLLVFYEG